MASIYFCKAFYEVCSKYHKQSHLFLLWQYKHNLLQLIIILCGFLQFGLQLRHKWISNSGEKSESHKMFLNTHNAFLVLNIIAKTDVTLDVLEVSILVYAVPHLLWNCHPSPLALSQVRADRDILIVYNTSS